MFFVGILQGLDTIGFYRTYERLLATSSPEVRKELPIKTAWLFVMKVAWYGALTMITAIIVRRFS